MTTEAQDTQAFNDAIRAAAYGVPVDDREAAFTEAREACAQAQASGDEAQVARTREAVEALLNPALAQAPDFGAGARPQGPSEHDLNAEIRRAWRAA